MTKLILIRHGESEANRNGIFAGQIDPDLQMKGIKQATLTAKYIVENYNVDKIYSSDLQRAYKTAMCLGEMLDMKIIKDQNLREIDGGEWEGMKYSEVGVVYPCEYDLWLKHIGQSCCVGGESVKQLGERIMSALTKIAIENDGKTVAIATHATPIRAAQSIIQCGGVDEMENIPWVSNASVTVIEYVNSSWKVVKASVDEHLSELRTELPLNV